MIVHLLGTGGADGVPGLYSDSRVSCYARRHGGKDVRTRTAALIDGCLKLDLGPDTVSQMNRWQLDARDWTAILFTHSDADHFAIEELQYMLYPFNEMEYAGCGIFANRVILDSIRARYPDWPFELHLSKSYCPFRVGDFDILPVHANHKPAEDAQNFIIRRDGKTLLYATDTGLWCEATWSALQPFRLDGLVIECTEGVAKTDYNGHLDVKECLHVVERLRGLGVVHDSTVIATTHHAHYGDATHAELEELLVPAGIQVGFDGLRFEI